MFSQAKNNTADSACVSYPAGSSLDEAHKERLSATANI